MNRGHFFFTCINCRSWAGRLWAGRPSALPVSWRSGDAGALARWASRTEGAPAPSPSRSFHRFKRSPNIIRLNNNNGQQLDGRNFLSTAQQSGNNYLLKREKLGSTHPKRWFLLFLLASAGPAKVRLVQTDEIKTRRITGSHHFALM